MKAFLETHGKIIIKPVAGSFGRKVLVLRKRETDVEVYDQKYFRFLDEEQFRSFLHMLRGQDFVIPKFVDSKTKENCSYHLRVHLMKDGWGRRRVAFINPLFIVSEFGEITNRTAFLRGTAKWDWFLANQFPKKLRTEVDDQVRTYAAALAACLQESLGDGFREIGLDIGLDAERRIWLFEANWNNVAASFHEFEVARHAVPYALRLARPALRPSEISRLRISE